MSLSRILNSNPSPSLRPTPHLSPVTTIPFDNTAYPEHLSDHLSAIPAPSRFQRIYPDHPSDNQHSLRGYPYHDSAQYQGPPAWDPYSRQWVHGDVYAFNPGATHYHSNDRGRFPSPHDVREPPPDVCPKDGDEDVAFRKRRRGLDEDSDYQPPGQRRVGNPFVPFDHI